MNGMPLGQLQQCVTRVTSCGEALDSGANHTQNYLI